MKHSLALGIALLSLALGGAEAKKEQPQYPHTHYYDWQFRAVEIKDENAADNVRHQMDFTVPLHGPWLTNPRANGMTVTWITRVTCAGGIEYREKGTEEFKRLWPVKYGQIDYSKDVHHFHLTGLKPDTEYEYRLLSNQDTYSTAYSGFIGVGREIYSFRTLNPEKDQYRVFITSDFHGGGRLNMDPLLDGTKCHNADLFFYLGDNVDDNEHMIRYYTTFGFLDDVTRAYGKYKPSIFIRGNHDFSGRETYQHGRYFPTPDKKAYQAFRHGPVLYVCLDTTWPSKENIQKEQMAKYVAEQVEWVRGLKKTEAWKTAKFRILLAHIAPTLNSGRTYFTEEICKVLNDTTPEGRIHAFLCGHDHVYRRINAGTRESRINNEFGEVNPKRYALVSDPVEGTVPYTVVICHFIEGMSLDVSAEKLVFKSHRWLRKPQDGLHDAFEITPDGKVKDLIKVDVFPFEERTKKKK